MSLEEHANRTIDALREENQKLKEENEKLKQYFEEARAIASTFELKNSKLESLIEELTGALKGLSFGVDWNNGTHAKEYRPKLLEALKKYEAWKGEK